MNLYVYLFLFLFSVLKTDPAVLPSKSSPGEFLQYKETIASTPTLSPNLAPSSGGGSGKVSKKIRGRSQATLTFLTTTYPPPVEIGEGIP